MKETNTTTTEQVKMSIPEKSTLTPEERKGALDAVSDGGAYVFPRGTEQAESLFNAVMNRRTDNLPAWYQGRDKDVELMASFISLAGKSSGLRSVEAADMADHMALALSSVIEVSYRLIMHNR